MGVLSIFLPCSSHDWSLGNQFVEMYLTYSQKYFGFFWVAENLELI